MSETLAIAPQLLINAAIAGSIYALASSGLALSYGVSGILNFAHGQMMMLGAYLFLMFRDALSPGALGGDELSVVSMLGIGAVSVALSAVFGGLIYLIFIAPFRNNNPLLPFVSTVAAGRLLENGVALVFGVNVQSISTNTESYDLGFGYVTPSQIFTIICALIVMFSLAILVSRSRFGRTIRALQSNQHGSEALGISVVGTHLKVFVLAAALAGLAGILVGIETSLQPTMGGAYTVKALAIMILGGLGNIWGTIAGSFILALLETAIVGIDFGAYSIPIGYRDAVAFVAILLILLWRPAGVLRRSKVRAGV
jgi:branched-chain amino acid transport system permease protein